jgi:hypothetical protein
MMNIGLFYDFLQYLKVSQQLKLSKAWGREPRAQPPNWGARLSILVWIITVLAK